MLPYATKVMFLKTLFMFSLSFSNAKLHTLTILERQPACEVESRFLSLAIGMSNAQREFQNIEYNSRKLKVLLSALKPAYLRLGGSASNYLFFKVGSTKPSTLPTFDNGATNIGAVSSNPGTQNPYSVSLPSATAPPTSQNSGNSGPSLPSESSGQLSPQGTRPSGTQNQQSPQGTQPSGTENKPSHQGTQPSGTQNQPLPQGAQPSGTNNKPSHQDTQPSGTQNQPLPQGAQPSGTNNKPSAQGTQLSGTQNQPSPQGAQPSGTQNQPSPQGAQPSGTQDKPSPQGTQQSDDPNQTNLNGGQNQMGQGNVPHTKPNSKKPNKPPKHYVAEQKSLKNNDGLFLNIQAKDPENPSDALQDFKKIHEDKFDVKHSISGAPISSGNGLEPDNGTNESGDELEAPAGSGNDDEKRNLIERGKISQPFWLMSDDFDKFYNFLADAGIDLIFDLGDWVRHSNGSWNSSNALDMLSHIAFRGFQIGWQLGNEPNSYGSERIVNATQNGKDLIDLRKILRSNPHFGTVLLGPDVTRPKGKTGKRSSEKYLKEYLKTNASAEVSAVSWHQYYVDGKSTSEKEMVSPHTLDLLKDQIQRMQKVMKDTNTNKPLWLTETGSAYGGGAKGLSDTFAASFGYLDKLGISGVYCNSVVMRQTFIKGSYAMLDDDYTPRPDYWLALLHKRLVGKRVLMVSGDTTRLRGYAHCTRNSIDYNPGAVTVIIINLKTKPSRVKFGKYFASMKIDQFLVTSSDGSLTTKEVMLNGKKLRMEKDDTLPNLEATKVKQPMKMPAYSYAFYVIPDANVEDCK